MIYCKDSIRLAEDNPDNSVHAVITDPPYGLDWLSGLNWDKVLPPKKIWEACFQVLRPGGFCLAFGHVRLYHRLACDLEDAGFIIKDCLCWGTATGYPHNVDLGKKNEECLGWGTKLKTAWEPILVAQKQIEGTYVQNIMKYHVGGFNIDECRIPYKDEADRKSLKSFEHFVGKDYGDDQYFSANKGGKKQCNIHPDGRLPANLVWLDPLFVEYDHIFMIPKPSAAEKREYNQHKTVKPLRLMERLIKLVTPRPSVIKEDVIVLDPFAGSGSTGVACKKLGRKFVGYENNLDSYNTAQRRIGEKVGNLDIFER